jgi:uncharacterized protein YqeY
MLEKIRKDYITSIKEKNVLEKNLLSIVIGDIQKLEKGGESPDDNKIINIVTKINKSLLEMLESESDKESVRYKDTKSEIEILSRYLPKSLSEDEIVNYIKEFKSENPNWNIGMIMKFFSDKPVDRKLVSKLINS